MKLLLNINKVEELRVRRGLLKLELAKKAKVAPRGVVLATTGRPVGVVVARKIAAALGVELGDIIANVTGGESGQAVAVG